MVLIPYYRNRIIALTIIVLLIISGSIWGLLNLQELKYKQKIDAYYKMNSSEFIIDGDYILDPNTHLEWAIEVNDMMYNWSEAIAYCKRLYYNDHSDWRLPNIIELSSLVNFERYDPATDIERIKPKVYRSSTKFIRNSSMSIGLQFAKGNFHKKIDDAKYHKALCVRNSSPTLLTKSGQTKSYALFDDGHYQTGVDSTKRFLKKDDLIFDNFLHKIWFQKINFSDFYDAEKYCTDLVIEGDSELTTLKDWRLPFPRELVSLITYDKEINTIDVTIFDEVEPHSYWSNTDFARNSIYTWKVSYYNGNLKHMEYKDYEKAGVLCIHD